MIKEVLQPRDIYRLIQSNHWNYADSNFKEGYILRDQAMQCACFATGGRISEVTGGSAYEIQGGELQTVGHLTDGTAIMRHVGGKIVRVGTHKGLTKENLTISDKAIKITYMPIVKRSRKLIAKLGPQVARRDPFLVPFVCGLYENRFYDQLVPFGLKIFEYLKAEEFDSWQQDRKVFPFLAKRAYQIIRASTGMFPNWFRMQADNFYGSFITKDSGRHSDFIGRVDAESSRPYTRFVFTEGLRDEKLAVDFDWINEAIRDARTS